MRTRGPEKLKSLLSGRPTGTWIRFCVTFAWYATLAVAVAHTSGCGSATSGGSGQQSPGQQPSGPRAPESGDLRFQQVDAPSEADQGSGGETSNVVVSPGGSSTANFANATGSPIEQTYGSCYPGVLYDCAFEFWVTPLPPGQSGLTVFYQGGYYANLDSDLTAIALPNTVITSLDLQPASGAYGAAWIQTSQGGGFDLKHEIVPPDQVQSVVAQDGAQSRVITAVSFDASAQANLLSFGWQGDTVTVYQTSVVNAAAEGVAAAATNLAAEGYIITAFGGDTTNGFLLVGTKVQGDTLARPIIVATQSNTPFSSGETAGYAPVGWVYYLTSENTQAYAVIYEK